MRIRAIAAAASLSGALALTALAVPGAQAADSATPTTQQARDFAKQHAAGATSAKARTFAADATGEPYAIDATFSNVKVNGGKPIVAGTTSVVHAPVTYTLTHPADVDVTSPEVLTDVDIYWVNSDASDGNVLFDAEYASCTPVTDTTATCTQSIDIDPSVELYNVDAGKAWKAEGSLIDTNGVDITDENADFSQVGFAYQDALASTTLQRRSTLTVNASPEPVYKGRTITVTGYLKRANWDTGAYAGYTKQGVKLQFRKKGTTSYPSTYLKTATSSSTGYLKTTYTASSDGYWRYNFLGTSTTPAVKASGDYVDVR
ncbi:hypothetical protein [Streptomyces sp. NPDC052225]|uniref:hypothetical protein n=1 Tax=Streptomyces sp. NPDC052225 TaxID=3154949 RepID=UPI003449DEF4